MFFSHIHAAFCLLTFVATSTAYASYKVGVISNGRSTQIVSAQPSRAHTKSGERKLIRHLPRFLFEEQKPSAETYSEYLVDDALLTQQMRMKLQTESSTTIPGAEVKVIVNQGPKENRINLTIVGDGYTQAEKTRFFEDALRTTQGLFTGSTFASYLPLFNVYAVFVPSAESGIGDGRPKRTALGLYRSPQGSKRGIMCGNTSMADQAIALAPATDYPILLANDEYYGGLGGQYAISTRSVRSGLIVLRHELGHNFGSVGEEYDGGQVYTGANFSSTPQAKWSYWAKAGLSVYEAKFLGGAYWWKNLSTGPGELKFEFPAGNFRLLADVSSVGWETPGDVEMSLDGNLIRLPGPFHDDRAFFTVGPGETTPGSHRLLFTERVQDRDNVLAFANLYAVPTDYDFTPNKIAAFTTYSDGGHKVGYRPTHNSCLMRDMMTNQFCSVDKENMWHHFLARISLIDAVTVGGQGSKQVTLAAPKLPGLQVAWYKVSGSSETEMPELRGKSQWVASAGGVYRVRVKFLTAEVRQYADYFAALKDFTIP